MLKAMSLATTTTASGLGPPDDAAVGVASAAVAPEQAASDGGQAQQAEGEGEALHVEGLLKGFGGRLAGQAAAPAVARRRETNATRAASSRRTTATGFPSWRAKSTASVTISATSMALAT